MSLIEFMLLTENECSLWKFLVDHGLILDSKIQPPSRKFILFAVAKKNRVNEEQKTKKL